MVKSLSTSTLNTFTITVIPEDNKKIDVVVAAASTMTIDPDAAPPAFTTTTAVAVAPTTPTLSGRKEIDVTFTPIAGNKMVPHALANGANNSSATTAATAVEEKKESEPHSQPVSFSTSTITTTTTTNNPIMMDVAPGTPAQIHHTASECEAMVLEAAVDDCVGCMDGVDGQQTFEERFQHQAAAQRQIALQHGLSEAEATLIRLQMMDTVTTTSYPTATSSSSPSSAAAVMMDTTLLPQLEAMLNVCGPDDSMADLCDGVVLPMDTTLPTSLPGDALVDVRLTKTARNLVDAMAESPAADKTTMQSLTTTSSSLTRDEYIQECAICNDSVMAAAATTGRRKPTFCSFPCCEEASTTTTMDEDAKQNNNSNVQVCTACMLVLTVATKDGTARVGRCPRCRVWIAVETLHSTRAELVVRKLETSGTCQSCLHVTTHLLEDDPATCDACFLGQHVPLMYECEECHRPQEIAHTLYRCQPTSQSYGNEMSPCHHCQKSSHWRIRYDQLPLIPANDVPEEWGGDDFLDLARAKVQRARQGIAQLDVSIVDYTARTGGQSFPPSRHGTEGGGGGCSIM